MSVDADLIFLPWLRRGGVAALGEADSLGEHQPGVASATAEIQLNSNSNSEVRVPVRLMGPGHVTALDPRQVVRTDPTRGSRAFEPNFFPLVEFDEPSLPWMFTPAGANAQAKLRPWLVLVVVRKQDGVRINRPERGSLPILRISRPANAAAELPDLADSWAWAHAQVTAEAGASPEALQTSLMTQPERSVSRLVCSRILVPDTDYIACVVPTFELGRKAGLGLEITTEDESKLAPAWIVSEDLTAVELPVYYSWDFATGAGGDFQSLALLLRGRPLPEDVGRRPFDVSQSGLHIDLDPTLSMSLTGALRPVESTNPSWPDTTSQGRFETALVEVLNTADDLAPTSDPLLAPPRYGAVQAGLQRVDIALETRWYERLNLDPAGRIIAQFGTRVIQQHQEALMASAWEQAAELPLVNRLLRHVQLSCMVATSLHTRHVATMAPGVGLQVLAPAQPRLGRSQAANRPGIGLVAQAQATGLTWSAYDTTLRRIARPRSAVNRRVQRVTIMPATSALPRTTLILTALQPASLLGRLVVPATRRISLEHVANTFTPPRLDIHWGEATAEGIAAIPPRPSFAFDPIEIGPHTHGTPPIIVGRTPTLAPGNPERVPVPAHPAPPHPTPVDSRAAATDPTSSHSAVGPAAPSPTPPPTVPPGGPVIDPRVDSADGRAFRRAALSNLTRFNPSRAPMTAHALLRGNLDDAFAEAIARTTPRETFAARVRGLVHWPGTPPSDDDALDQVGASLRFPQPMSVELGELSQDAMLPGLEGVPPNTIVPLETNTRFVEAYLVGLNTEMARELTWREYPPTGTTTYFRQFWDARVVPDAPLDVEPIAEWGDRSLGASSGGGERFVMLVRSELLRRYPNALIYATRPGPTEEGQPDPPLEESHPVFTGALEPDVRFFGFDLSVDEMAEWSIVIQEHPSEPRFGVEVGTDNGTATHVPTTQTNAAQVAHETRQMPVRISMPSSVLLGRE